MASSLFGLFSHGTQPPSNGLGALPVSLAEALQNTALAAKLNQAASAHPNLRSQIPAQSLEAKPPLPDPYPPVPEAGHFDAAQQEYGCRVSFSEWLKQRELFIKVFARRRQHQFPVFADLVVAFQIEAFHDRR